MTHQKYRFSPTLIYLLGCIFAVGVSHLLYVSNQPYLNQTFNRDNTSPAILSFLYITSYWLGFWLPILSLLLIAGLIMFYRNFRKPRPAIVILIGVINLLIAIGVSIAVAKGLPVIEYIKT